ncbi:DNA pilot protein [Microviridae sp.]|nr:DNA pilot protein [Microviridae sp.]
MTNKKTLLWVCLSLLLTHCVTVKKRTINVHIQTKITMPLTLAAATALTGAAALAGGGINAASTANLNKKNRRWSEQMYQRQKADNLAFWAQQNTYNSPEQQMARFKAAGLNPNLIYGQGNSGNAGPISTPDARTPDTRVPEWGSGIAAGASSGLQAYTDLQIKGATANNLKLQADVITQEAQLKRAQTLSTLLNVDKTKWSWEFEKSLADVTADFRRAQLHNLKTSTDLSIRKDTREAVKLNFDIAESIQRVQSSRLANANTAAEKSRIEANTAQINQQLRNLKKDGVLKDIEIQLRRKGINPNDPMYQRILGQAIDGIIDSPLGLSEKIKKLKDDIWNWAF